MEKTEIIQSKIQQYIDLNVLPFVKEIETKGTFPVDLVKDMQANSLFGLTIPEAYSGSGLDYKFYIDTVLRLSQADAALGVILAAHTSLCVSPIFKFGTDLQKAKYLPQLAKTKLGAFALTETNAGSNPAILDTCFEEHSDHFLLNGSKLFITNAPHADVYLVFARNKNAENTSRSMACFIVEKDMPGVSFGEPDSKLGIRPSSSCEVILTNVKIPKENLLGQLGQGYKIALSTLTGGRISISAQALGIANAALKEVETYSNQRRQFGQTLAEFQHTQFRYAELKTKIKAATLLLNEAVSTYQTPANIQDSAMAKLYCAKVAVEAADFAVQIHGGYGYMTSFIVERLYRDAKITEIYEGTSEVQKIIIGQTLLKK